MNTDNSYINTLLAEVEELRSTKAELLAALEAMLKVALKCDDKAWAMAVERADETRPCDMALDAIAKAKGRV